MKSSIRKRGLILSCVYVIALYLNAQEINIIPRPSSVIKGSGYFTLSPSVKVYHSDDALAVASFLTTIINTSTGYKIQSARTSVHKSGRGIYLLSSKDFADTTKGAYTLDITPTSIVARAADNTGLFYAVQSIRQLLPPAIESNKTVNGISWKIPAAQISDAPRFQWRGYMQDVSRTFYGVDVIKKYLDIMALYKMNTFHFHLTDDQGWRIEIKKHPELTAEKATVFGKSSKQPAYRSGYYTQQQIKDIVAYAAARHITIVPEIDVPGHCWPIVITHPTLATNKNLAPDYVISFMDSYNYWGFQYTPNPLDPTKEEVYSFLNDVFTEIAELFPGKYIHFGGDEVRHEFWENVPHIKDFMKQQGMTKVTDLQSYFVKRVSNIIDSKGKIPIGWNDIIEHQPELLPKSTAIMSWIGSGAVKEAARFGFPVIATPSTPLYFDISQDNINDGTMVDWNYGGGDGVNGKGNTIKKVYMYDPQDGLTKEEGESILGVQANMWPAVPQEVKDINVQDFPRLLAVAEIGWTSPVNKDYNDFLSRLGHHYPRLDTLRVDYFKKGGFIINNWKPALVTTTFKTTQWDVTQKVYAAGRAQAGFLYTSGESFLKVKNVKLLEDGKVVAEDLHESLADKFRGTPFKKDMFFYILEIPQYNPNTKYILQADIAGATSNNSTGNITFNLSPYNPFSVVEASK
ncbi:MAG: beta-N-acetylhexosaminidase [Niabella sp.]